MGRPLSSVPALVMYCSEHCSGATYWLPLALSPPMLQVGQPRPRATSRRAWRTVGVHWPMFCQFTRHAQQKLAAVDRVRRATGPQPQAANDGCVRETPKRGAEMCFHCNTCVNVKG